ncbi:phosphotransferase [Paenibacillus sp. FJAT-27812]|uniref:phosphotransferase n=1 Tax=Paenibacillus sp. FJAT-27812 TaxID=1684143 RepID=UPI0006A7E74F|nr:phosphotransferase [Paenibacillus sp. FJAT-27812]
MHPIVGPDGRIIEEKIWRRETLYKGMNGSSVERIYLAPNETIIFKPLTNHEQLGKEAWVYEHVLPALPRIYPQLLACSSSADTTSYWMMFEDLGALKHAFDEDTASDLISYIANWHALPTSHLLHAPLRGPKPQASVILKELLLQGTSSYKLAAQWPSLPSSLLSSLFAMLQHENVEAEDRVFSHGDLHLGNYASVNGHIKVLDWEHAHLNSRYWDLYHVIDLSHPTFPKEMSPTVRERLLDRYLLLIEQDGYGLQKSAFKRGYYLFSCLFSLWMLKLITNDIQANNGTWPIEQLKQQLDETTSNLLQCAKGLQL